MMTKSSSVSVTRAKVSESQGFRARETARAVGAIAPETETRSELSTVVHVSFGEWQTPKVDHPDSLTIQNFIESLNAGGYAEIVKEGRRDLASWIDGKVTLRSLRLAAGLSQEQLAAAMETSQSQIARIESGRQDLSLKTMKRLALALGVDTHQILDAAGG
jgi:DNA-binding XRE family transcriptional regulator